MAGLSLRDRFFTPPVARAVTSPGAILAIGAGAGIGILTGGGIVAAVVLGAVGWAARVAAAIPRRARGSRIDPFTLSEPWRHFVTDALQARTRFHEAVDAAQSGPMRDRLQSIQERVDAGVEDVWRIARRGDDLVAARRQVDPDAIRAEMERTRANADQPWATSSTLERTMEALAAQLATADRLDRVIADADGQLRLLNARLDEAAARTIELSVQSGDVSALGGLDDDVDQMVDEMEALRQAIEETGGPSPAAGTA